MKNLKKVLALVVVFAMMFTTVAFASYPDVAADADYAEAVEILSALEVLEGDDQGTFNPDSTIKRSEFAAVVIRALGMESSAAGAAGATSFVDVAANHWAAGYINLATQYGIINGRGNGIFDPDGNVTYQEAIKMLCVALGYAPMAETKGGYPAGYVAVAGSIGMVNGVPATSGAALRSTVAMLTANALEIPKMDQTGFGSNVTYEVLDDYDNYQTLLTDRDIYVLEGTVSAINVEDGTVDVAYTEGSDDYEFGWDRDGDEDLSDSPATIYVNNTNIADFYQKSVKVFVEKDAKKYYAVAVVAGVANETLTVDGALLETAELSAGDNAKVEYYETKDATKTTKINVEANAKVYVNSKSTVETYTSGKYDLKKKVENKDAVVEFVNNDDDKYFDVINVTIYQHAIVKSVNATTGKIYTLKGNQITIDEEEDAGYYSIADADGNEIAMTDLKEGDVLAIVTEGNVVAKGTKDTGWKKIDIINLGDSSVTGTLNGYEDVENIMIDGNKYEVGKQFADRNESKVFKLDDKNVRTEVKMDIEGKFYLGITDKIIGFDGDAVATGNYGYIIKAAKAADAWNDGAYQIKMLTAEGIEIFDVYKTLNFDGKDLKEETKDAYKTAFAKFDGDGDDDYANKAKERIVTYKANSNGEIKVLTTLTGIVVGKADAKVEYNASRGMVGDEVLADSVIVMNFPTDDLEDATMSDISYLVDDGDYYGVAAYDEATDSEASVFAIFAGQAAFDAKAGIAVVESKVSSKHNDEDAITIKYYQDGELKTGIITDDANSTEAKENIDKGDLLAIVADGEGVVTSFEIIAKMSEDKSGVLKVVDGAFDKAYGAGGTVRKEAYSVYGYVKSITDRSITIVTAKDTEVVVPNTIEANQYAWYNKGNNKRVEIGDWQIDEIGPTEMDGLANFDDDTAYFVFIKMYDGAITDIYSTTEAGAIFK